MSKSDNSGPAFPKESDYGFKGMTLRDYFAAKAMQAVLCDSAAKQSISIYAGSTGRTFGQEVAIQAYDMADCMLAERVK